MSSSQDLASTPVTIDVWPASPVPDQITVELQRVNAVTNNVADNCLTVSDSTTITVNGLPGTLVDAGGLPFDADTCTDATFKVVLSPLPSVLDVVIDDGTARLEVRLVRDAFAKYQVATCDAAACAANN